MVAPDVVMPDAATPEMTGPVVSLLTVTAMAAAGSQETEYGDAACSARGIGPSNVNCTPATRTLSLAVALTAMLPATVVFATGALIETGGAVVSLLTVTATAADVVVLPAASRATAVSV